MCAHGIFSLFELCAQDVYKCKRRTQVKEKQGVRFHRSRKFKHRLCLQRHHFSPQSRDTQGLDYKEKWSKEEKVEFHFKNPAHFALWIVVCASLVCGEVSLCTKEIFVHQASCTKHNVHLATMSSRVQLWRNEEEKLHWVLHKLKYNLNSQYRATEQSPPTHTCSNRSTHMEPCS